MAKPNFMTLLMEREMDEQQDMLGSERAERVERVTRLVGDLDAQEAIQALLAMVALLQMRVDELDGRGRDPFSHALGKAAEANDGK